MSKIDYKQKYQELKLKFMNSVDTAFRLGYQQGMLSAQQQMMQEQMAQQQAMEQQMAAQQGQPQEEQAQPEEEVQEQPEEQMHPDGSELDQHIAQLEALLGKSEPGTDEYDALKKSLDGIKAFRTSQIQLVELKKVEKAIKAVGSVLGKTVGPKAQVNLNPTAKRALTKQEEIVAGIMDTWEKEESKAFKGIADIISVEGLAKE